VQVVSFRSAISFSATSAPSHGSSSAPSPRCWLIACVNVANLLLVRAVSREKETTVPEPWEPPPQPRTAMDIRVRPSSLVRRNPRAIAAVWGLRILVALSPAALPGVAKIAINGRALVFTVAISASYVCSRIGSGARLGPYEWSARGTTRQSRRATSSLIVIEVALASLLMISAGLLLKSSPPPPCRPGFNPINLLTMQVPVSRHPARHPRPKPRLLSELQQKLAALPVVSATVGGLPIRNALLNPGGGDPFLIKAAPTIRAGRRPVRQHERHRPRLFSDVPIPLRAGRFFAPADTGASFSSDRQ